MQGLESSQGKVAAMALTHAQAKRFYDRFGRKQDSQGFYEDRALDELIAHGEFARAHKVFELGCGTGRLALRLLQTQLPEDATYLGFDLSETMTALTRERLTPFAARAQVLQASGEMQFPLADGSVDRVIANYVFDLLSDADARQAVAEAYRVLRPGGRLCLVSLTQGIAPVSRLICRLWSALYRLHAPLVGGCRPIRLLPFLAPGQWMVIHHHTLSQFGVPSEVLVASPVKS